MLIEHVSIVVRGGGYELCKAQIALNHQAGLNPVIGSVFVGKLDGFEITGARIVIVKPFGLEVLHVGRGRDSPIVINKPPDRRSGTSPVDVVYVLLQQGTVVFLAAKARTEVVIKYRGAQDIIDEARISGAKTRQANRYVVTQGDVDGTVNVIASATIGGGGYASPDIGTESFGVRLIGDDSNSAALRGRAIQRGLRTCQGFHPRQIHRIDIGSKGSLRHRLLIEVNRCRRIHQKAAAITHAPEYDGVLARSSGLYVETRNETREIFECSDALLLDILSRKRLHHHGDIL